MAFSPDKAEHRLAIIEAERVISEHKNSRWQGYFPQLNTKEITSAIPYATSLILGAASAMVLSTLFQDTQILFFTKLAQNTDILVKVKDPAIGLAGFGGVLGADFLYRAIVRR